MLLGEKLEGGRIRDPEIGLIFPWYTSTCLEWLKGLDLKYKRIWEYGLGDSTLWYDRMGAFCYGVDNVLDWVVKAHRFQLSRYFPLEPERFNVVVHPIQCSQESGFATARWTNKGSLSHFHWANDEQNYLHSIYGMTYNIVVIDGLFRDQCTKHALECLLSGGHLIIDNYKQPSVEEHWLLTEKLIEGMPITIYKEPGHYDWQTAVITKP